MSSETDQTPQQFLIQVTNRQQSYQCIEGESLLKGMELENAHCIEVGCRGGGCGMCKIRILEGRFNSKRMSKAHISDTELAEGFALACRVYPCGDMQIESDHFEIKSAAEK
ncbi:2Fe-2S iron-sulfur cluster-binding protein [uncultured Neptuniibacter sp.]|uniref:2Fe-2S iron-sulfur cluster-binding protein n=1 Tax=uncultured Neptuniibacter sp. TaxID=502143 RepID=UPI0026299060|nr:2Fe-2S iron-sulfur cluster-binding protein [uncultured Neptuniibacter sp.]